MKPGAAAQALGASDGGQAAIPEKLTRKRYEAELLRLQIELVKLAAWVKAKDLKVVALFEGRDAAGKGGAIQRITEAISPRLCRVVALSAPTERERSQWYFQRYVPHLPAAGEIVLFDRSWYNRAGVERVMGFCKESEYREFLRSVPEFERMLTLSGIILVKYWFSVSDEAQEHRFQARNHSPIKRWKLSPMDLESRKRWVEYSKAKDEMFKHTDLPASPWWVVDADDKKRARLNCVSHFLAQVPYEDLTPTPVDMPARKIKTDYVAPNRSVVEGSRCPVVAKIRGWRRRRSTPGGPRLPSGCRRDLAGSSRALTSRPGNCGGTTDLRRVRSTRG